MPGVILDFTRCEWGLEEDTALQIIMELFFAMTV